MIPYSFIIWNIVLKIIYPIFNHLFQSVPPLDTFTYLQQSLISNRLVVTVPWIVAFLGMMDPVSPHLPCYRPTLELLVKIYLSLPLPHMSPLLTFLLRSSLGWLFDSSFFPMQVFCSLSTATVELPLPSECSAMLNLVNKLNHKFLDKEKFVVIFWVLYSLKK